MLSQPEVVVESVPESEEKPKLEKKLEEAVVKEVAVNDETISKQKSELIPEHVSAQSSTAQPETQSAASAAVLAPNAVEGNTQTELAENPFEGLIRRINSLKDSTYPLRAKKRGYQGTVVVELNLDREGRLIDVNIYQGCRHGILNDAALELIERVLSQPYRHYIGKEVQLRIPVTYKLL